MSYTSQYVEYMAQLRWIEWFMLLVVVWILMSLYKAHRDPAFNFNVFDLIMENGRVSRLGCVFMGSWLVLTWMMLRLTVDGKMTEGYFTSYAGACFAGTIAKLFTNGSNKPAEPLK